MDTLSLFHSGGSDVLVVVNGFGSRNDSDPSRWIDAALFSGRTSYLLRYDSQEFPSEDPSVVDLIFSSAEFRSRWDKALLAASRASSFLVRWVSRWVRSGKSVYLVGFSLGARVVFDAASQLDPYFQPRVSVFLIAGAVDSADPRWPLCSSCRISNVYSERDSVLSYLYSSVSSSRAAGSCHVPHSFVRNINVSDLVGSDHFLVGRQASLLFRLAASLSEPQVTSCFSSKSSDLSTSYFLGRLFSWLCPNSSFSSSFRRDTWEVSEGFSRFSFSRSFDFILSSYFSRLSSFDDRSISFVEYSVFSHVTQSLSVAPLSSEAPLHALGSEESR